MNDKIAIIDCGTNTFHLMILDIKDGEYNILSREKQAVRIGAGGINDGRILDDAKERAFETLNSFKEKISKQGIKKVWSFATSAFRNAINGQEIQEKINKELDLNLEIISGDREAELIYKGVHLALNFSMDPVLVMDIGGGSVEFIIGNADGIFWKKSYEIGGQRLMEKFHHSDPITTKEIEQLENYLSVELQSLFDALVKYKPLCLAGASGTFDTLSEIHSTSINEIVNKDSPELSLSIEAYHLIHKQLIASKREERAEIPGMIPMRVDMIVVASCLINFLLARYFFQDIRVSTYSLKEGVLSEILTS